MSSQPSSSQPNSSQPSFLPYPENPLSRRRLLAGSLALGAGAALVAADAAANPALAVAQTACPPAEPLPDFPAGMEASQRTYRNWSGEIVSDGAWTCAPRTADEVVLLANWAHRYGYRLRAQGFRHGWAPLTVSGPCAPRTLLVDTTVYLTGMAIVPGGPAGAPARVRVQTGAAIQTLLGFLENAGGVGGAGYGLVATPAPGDLSVGGALAIDAHGTAVPAAGEARAPGTTYGSLSNLVTSLTAVVWDGAGGRYAQRTFARTDADCAALLAHLGRAFVTEVTLAVGANSNLRCVSRTDITAEELFAAPGAGGQTFASFLDTAGRAEAIWFAFTSRPWLKVWSVAPSRPPLSRPVSQPYNYPFSDNVPEPVARLAGRIMAGEEFLAPAFGQAQYDATVAGLVASASADIWGPSKNLLLYVRPTTLRVHADGYAVTTSRANVQRVVHEFAAFYRERLAAYAAGGRFPVNGAVEIRVTGLDDPGHVGPTAVRPTLSALCPRTDRPDWDVAVWLDVLTLPGTGHANAFLREIERFVFDTFDGSWAGARVEWSKGWAYTDAAAWADAEVIEQTVPATLPGWPAAVATLDRHDPHRVFGNPFLDRLLG